MKNKILAIMMTFLMFMSALTSCREKTSTDDANKESVYQEAIELLENGRYQEAYSAFSKLGNYKETNKYLSKFHYLPLTMVTTAKGVDEAVMKTTVVYNDSNLPIKATVFDSGITNEFTYKYNADGNIVEKESVSSISGKSVYKYFYDTNGKCSSMLHTLPNGDEYTFEYVYDTSGKLTEARYIDEGEIRYTLFYEYDKSGNLINRKEIDKRSGEGVTLAEYTYDKNGNLIKSTYGSFDKKTTYYSYISTYDKDNMLIKKVFVAGSEKTEFNFAINEDRTEVKMTFESDGCDFTMICKYKLVYIDSNITDEMLSDILDDIRLFME